MYFSRVSLVVMAPLLCVKSVDIAVLLAGSLPLCTPLFPRYLQNLNRSLFSLNKSVPPSPRSSPYLPHHLDGWLAQNTALATCSN
jgi:hypothetical protein